MRGHFRKAPDDGQVRPNYTVPFIHKFYIIIIIIIIIGCVDCDIIHIFI
jgi:hypothetical protein